VILDSGTSSTDTIYRRTLRLHAIIDEGGVGIGQVRVQLLPEH